MTKEIIHYSKEELRQLSNLELLDRINQVDVDVVHLARYLKNHCGELLEELIFRTRFLDNNYKHIPILARLYCLRNNIVEQPKCHLQGCDNNAEWDCGARSFRKYCCHQHFLDDPTVQDRREQTMLERYGVRTPMESEEFKQHAKEVCIREFGVENNGQREDVKEKIKQTNMKRHGAKSFVESDEFKQKARETCQRKYKVDHIALSNEFKTLIKSYWRRNHNVENPFQLKKIQEKAQTTFNRRYVEDEVGRIKINERRKQTMIKHHGVEHYAQSPEFHKKCHKRCTNPKYPDMEFATSWEFMVYDFLTEHNIAFEYQPSIVIPYEYDGKQHTYHPDFLVGDKIVEVKSDHFFRVNETTGIEEMYCPYRYPEWSDEYYKRKCGKEEAKHQCMLANNVIILRKKEIENLSVDMFLP